MEAVDFWPKKENCLTVFETEAESLPDEVLLSVHEPMLIEHKLFGQNNGDRKTEQDLLTHLLKIERPIPIIGSSGVGKSHLIRWLDAQLKIDDNFSNYHVKRIPKNSGLRNVMQILLDGLTGGEYEELRSSIKKIGDKLSTEEVAEYLIVAIKHGLDLMLDKSIQRANAIRQSGDTTGHEIEKKEIRINQSHLQDSAANLQALILDPTFQEQLVAKSSNGRVYQIAQRLTGNATIDDIAKDSYSFGEDDINFDAVIGELNKKARDYIRNVQLNTNKEKQSEVISLLNKVVSDAARKTFQNFFKIDHQQFIDLFTDLRRQLKVENKTLVLLIEDMAAISAIEDDLIDGLIQERVYAGEEKDLCAVHSAIAVTEGYPGYLNRRDTLATRAQGEWLLLDKDKDYKTTLQRIINLCGKYIDTARKDKADLKLAFKQRPYVRKVWGGADHEDMSAIAESGVTKDNIPLFPLNAKAIETLAVDYCSVHGDLHFKPRVVIQKILQPIILEGYDDFKSNKFPERNYGAKSAQSSLLEELRRELGSQDKRIDNLISVWGRGVSSLKELSNLLPSAYLEILSLHELAELLSKVRGGRVISQPTEPDKVITPSVSEQKETKDTDYVTSISKSVDEAFDKKNIDQKEANVIRNFLYEELIKASLNVTFFGASKLPDLKRGNRFRIFIPFNANNEPSTLIDFASKNDFESNPQYYKTLITSVLRMKYLNGVNYEKKYEDLCVLHNFLSEWIPVNTQKLIKDHRKNCEKEVTTFASNIFVIFPRIGEMSSRDRMASLVTNTKNVNELKPIITNGEYGNLFRDAVSTWQENQSWLDYFGPGRTVNGLKAIEGDLIERIRFRPQPNKKLISEITNIAKDYLNQYQNCHEEYKDLSSSEEFKIFLEALLHLANELGSEGQFTGLPETALTLRKLQNRVDKILKDHSVYWKSVKSLTKLTCSGEDILYLSDIDKSLLNDVEEVTLTWLSMEKYIKRRIDAENKESNSDARIDLSKKIDDLLHEYVELLSPDAFSDEV